MKKKKSISHFNNLHDMNSNNVLMDEEFRNQLKFTCIFKISICKSKFGFFEVKLPSFSWFLSKKTNKIKNHFLKFFELSLSD